MVDHAAPFDAKLLRLRRARAAKGFHEAAFLHARAAEELVARLGGVNRTFARGVVLGGGSHFAATLAHDPIAAAKTAFLVSADPSPALARDLALDMERLPFAPESLDLVVAVLGLHWVNDLPGALTQIRRALKPDGLFLGAMLGGDTLHELRACLMAAEDALLGGAALRVGPFADLRDAAGLLQRAGFALPVADIDRAIVRYRNPVQLLVDLRAMGETAALRDRPPALRRAVLLRAMELYSERFSDADGKVRATFETIHLSAWAPAPSQQKPLRPGSAKVRLADALGVTEQSAGEQAGE